MGLSNKQKNNPKLFWVIYEDQKGNIELVKKELTGVEKLDDKVFQEMKVKKVLKKILQEKFTESIKDKKITKKLLISFLTVMEKGGTINKKTGVYNFNIPNIVKKAMRNSIKDSNVEDIEFYLYINIQLVKARLLYDILMDFKGFKKYIDDLKVIEKLPNDKKPEAFTLLKGKIINPLP